MPLDRPLSCCASCWPAVTALDWATGSCGVVAAEVFKNAGITVKPVTLDELVLAYMGRARNPGPGRRSGLGVAP